MTPRAELVQLIAEGVSLVERYDDPSSLAAARSRFQAAPSLEHLRGPRSAADRIWPSLPAGDPTPSSRPPRVLIATPDIVGPVRNGGIGTACTALAYALACAGQEVTILYTLGRWCEEGRIEDWVAHYDSRRIRFVPLPPSPGPAAVHGPRTSYAAYRWIARQEFDVVHFPEWGGTAFCSVQAKGLGAALRQSTICVGLHSPTVWHDLEDRRVIDRTDQLERDFLERRSVELADVVISPSQYLLRWIGRWGWTLPERTYVQPYVTTPGRHAGGHRRQVREIVFFGRLESRKGLEVFCEAVDRLASAGSLAGARVTFVGKPGTVAGHDSLEYVRVRAAAWGLEWNVQASLSRDAALEYLVSREALAVMPSLADNTPNTVLECLAAGIPFVASAVGGIPETVAPEDHSRALVPPTPDALAEAIAARLREGALPVRPAADAEAVRHGWIAWHVAEAERRRSEGAAADRGPGPTVTVCMATHDRPQFLDAALESLRRQTYPTLEVVLVDDGSPGRGTADLLAGLEPEFRERGWILRREPRRYPGAARNTAAAWAHGRYLVFMDDDNLACPGEIESLVAAAESSGADIVTCGHDAFDTETTPERSDAFAYRWIPIGAAAPLALFRNTIGDTNMLVRREAFFTAGGFDEESGAGLFEDWSFFWKALVRGLRIEALPEALYWYRLGPHGFGQRSPAYEGYRRAMQPVLDLLPEGLALGLLFASGAARWEERPARQRPAGPGPTGLPATRMRDRVYPWLVRLLRPTRDGADHGEHLAGRFEQSSEEQRLVPPDRDPAGVLPLMPAHQVEVSWQGREVLLRASGDEPQTLLVPPEGGFSAAGPLIVRLEITAPVPTVAQFFWKTPGAPIYCEEQSMRTPLDRGRNVSYVRIPARRIVGRLRFDPSAHPGDLVVHGLAIRRES